MTLWRASVLIVVALALVESSAGAERTVPGEIVFVRGAPPAIWVMRSDGTHERQIYAGESAGSPAWSPDHRWIAFVEADYYTHAKAAADIWLIRPNGTEAHQLTHTYPAQGAFPSWSPDGTKIAFDHIGMGIWTVNPDGTDLSPVTHGSDDFDPAWSPDGTRIAFARQTNGPSAIWIVDADGTHAHQLIPTPTRSDGDDHPAWSPDGRWITFDRSITLTPPNSDGYEGTGWSAIARSDGTHAHVFLRHGGAVSWSPDGAWVAFVSSPSELRTGKNTTPTIFKIHPNHTSLRRLTPTGDYVSEPDW